MQKINQSNGKNILMHMRDYLRIIKIIDDINFRYNEEFEKFNFSLNKHIYSVQFFESIVAFEIDKKKCCLNNLLSNSGQDSKINDLTWEGNEIKILTHVQTNVHAQFSQTTPDGGKGSSRTFF